MYYDEAVKIKFVFSHSKAQSVKKALIITVDGRLSGERDQIGKQAA